MTLDMDDDDRALDRRDRLAAKAGAERELDVRPRDLDDYPAARDAVDRLALTYDSIEVDRLPPMGALHWLLRCHHGQTVYVCRVTADGRLLSVQR